MYPGGEGKKSEDEEKQIWKVVKEKITEPNIGTDLGTKNKLVKTLLKKTKLPQRKTAEIFELGRGVVERQREDVRGNRSKKNRPRWI